MIELPSWVPVLGDYSPAFIFVAWIVLGLSVFLAISSTILLIHHVISNIRRKHWKTSLRRAAIFMAPSLVVPGEIEGISMESVEQFGLKASATVLRQARGELRGELAVEISGVLESIGETSRLIRLSRARKPWIRAAAFRGLGQCGGDKAREALMDASENEIPEVRRAARDGLLMERSEESIRVALQSYLEDSTLRVAWRRSFYARLAVVAADELLGLLSSGQLVPDESKLALEALGDARIQGVLSLAQIYAASPDPELRASAVRVIGKLAQQSLLPLLVHALDDPEWFVRAAAAKSMGAMKCDQRTCHQLAAKLTDRAWWVRANAAQALAAQGPAGNNELLSALEWEDRFGRHAALNAIAFANLTSADQLRLAEMLSRLPDDGLDRASVEFLQANIAMERV